MADRDHLFQRLCHEAVLACGSDHVAIENFVRQRIETMGAPERHAIERDRDRILAFQAPGASPFTH